jgi:DNA-binding transcriptional regulator YiaG
MTGAELKVFRNELGLSRSQAARQVEVSERTFARWESGAQTISEGAIKLFLLLNNRELAHEGND